MKLISHGAAREVTGTCHELRVGERRILLDCGLFQGHRKLATEKNATVTFPLEEIDAVVLSHAHMDHAGRLPLLVKRGYRGPIFSTFATRDLAAVMLQDAGYIQEKDEEYFRKHCAQTRILCDGPLYTQGDSEKAMTYFQGVNYLQSFPVTDGVTAKLLDAGHILGSAMVVLEMEEAAPHQSQRSGTGRVLRLGFTGDLGRKHLPILRDPSAMPTVDVLLCESTYGDRTHDDVASARQALEDAVNRTAKRGGKVLIPAFSMERTQEILYDLHLLWDGKRIPSIPIFVDSPLASEVTRVFMTHPECFDPEMYEDFLAKHQSPFEFELLKYTRTTEESKALNEKPGPMVILSASGMCEAGRIRHHIRSGIEDPRNTLLAVGFMAENTLGRRLVDPSVAEVTIFDHAYQKRAEVVSINAYSGHADCHDLDRFLSAIPGLKHIFLVHGEETGMTALAKRTKERLGVGVTMPERGVAYELSAFLQSGKV